MIEFADAHQDLIFVTRRGFTFLVANEIGWIIVGIQAQRWPAERTATLLLVMGAVTTPAAFGLRALLGLPGYTPDNPLNRLGLLLALKARGFAAGPLCVGAALLIAAAWLY
jgi:hypothetical protein